MNIKLTRIFKIFFILLLIIYVNFFPINEITNKLEAVLTLLFSIILLYKSKGNLILFLMFFFIFYSNYSIVLGEYIIGGDLGAPFHQVKNTYYYGVTIRLLLLFMSIITLFYDGKSLNYKETILQPKNNKYIFYSIIFVLIYVLVMEVDRGDLQSYSVRISPLYEYSKLLFLFAYFTSGKSTLRKVIFFFLVILFILQDFYYGGRITSLQLIILCASTIFISKLSVKKIITYGFIAIFLNSIVGSYRASYSLDNISLLSLFDNLIKNYFVFDTPVYAYYASVTHVAASEFAEFNIRLDSLFAFIKSIFIGSNDIMGNVTLFVSKEYFSNLGGGLVPTHFYFWLGLPGVIIFAFLLIYIINKLSVSNNDYQKLIYLSIVLTVPRWYLYSPNTLLRGDFLFVTLIYIIFFVTYSITVKTKT